MVQVYIVFFIEPAVHPSCLLSKPRDFFTVDKTLFRQIYLLVNIFNITRWVRWISITGFCAVIRIRFFAKLKFSKPWSWRITCFVMRTALFWAVTERVVVIPYQSFGTTYGVLFTRVKSPLLTAQNPRSVQFSCTSRWKLEVTHSVLWCLTARRLANTSSYWSSFERLVTV
jgi:hypothetical protein